MRGGKRVEDIFSWTAIAHQTIELYKRLIDERKNKQRRDRNCECPMSLEAWEDSDLKSTKAEQH